MLGACFRRSFIIGRPIPEYCVNDKPWECKRDPMCPCSSIKTRQIKPNHWSRSTHSLFIYKYKIGQNKDTESINSRSISLFVGPS